MDVVTDKNEGPKTAPLEFKIYKQVLFAFSGLFACSYSLLGSQ